MNCPVCRKAIPVSDGLPSFCPWCGAKMALSEDVELNDLLLSAESERDYAKKREILLSALERYPGNIEIEKRLLYIGRLWEKGGKPDFYRIPFWPLNALEKPKEFPKRERIKMLESFFNDPNAARVAALSGDESAFYREYYTKMAADYMEWFIKNASSNVSFLFFKRSEQNRLNRCAQCVKTMLSNLEGSQAVPEDRKPLMRQALLDGFRTVFGCDLAQA